MFFVYFILAWMVGLVMGAFTITQVLIIFFFGIPFTLKLNKEGKLKSLSPIRSYIISIIILSALFVLSLWIMNKYFSSMSIPYYIGLGIALLASLGKVGANPSNISDYLETNKSCLKSDNYH